MGVDWVTVAYAKSRFEITEDLPIARLE